MAPPSSSDEVAEGDRALWGRRWRPCAALLPLAFGTLLFGASASEGILDVGADVRPVFLFRALELASGASPLLPLLLACVFVYGFGTACVLRLRFLADAGRLAHAAADPRGFWRRERALYDAALAPREARDFVVTKLLLLAPWILALWERPDIWWRKHDFSLEDGPLSFALWLGLLVCQGATLIAALQITQLWRRMDQLLRWFVASESLDAFDKLPAILRRTVAAQLAEGVQEERELQAVFAGLGAPAAADLEQLEQAAANARDKLDEDSGATGEARACRRQGLAGYVAFGLVRWVTQFSYLMTVATVGSVLLVVSSAAYVFTLRRMLSTVFSLLIVLVVVIGAAVFFGSERDEVLSRIGGTPPGKLSWHGNLKRVLSFAILPLTVALATNYPNVTQSVLSWFQTLGR